ncbi:VTT domain-containing protein [Paraburkholderia sp.]|uniref:VTT domain-containing protein n=1 Tax=Paraburkholderia sp. TaxID=1926495 RepID=UPI002F3EB0D2
MIEFPHSEISTWGGAIVFLNVLLTRLGVPIPAVPVLLYAGSAIASGALSFWYVLPAAVLGALIGDGIWFAAGRIYGQRLINALSRRSMAVGTHVRTARGLFERFGAPIVSASKFIPGLAIATPPLMGTTRVDPKIFAAWDLLGAVAWATFWLTGGALFDRQLRLFVVEVRSHGATVIDLVLGLSLLYFIYRCIQRWRFRRWMARVKITPEQLEATLRTESPPVILDARPESAVTDDTHRIPGARRFDPGSQADIEEALPGESRVVYCVCHDDATAMRITQHMRRKGFTRIRALKGGLDAWARRGYAFDPLPSQANADALHARVQSLRTETEAVTLRAVAPRKRASGKPRRRVA